MSIREGISKQVKNGEIEIWRDLEGYEGYYQVSNQGRIKSLARYNDKNKNKTFTVLEDRIIKTRKNYKKIEVYVSKNGIVERINVAAAVWNAFKSPKRQSYKRGYKIVFKDGDYTNINISNINIVNIKQDRMNKAKKYIKYIIENKCTRSRCAIHFGVKEFSVSNAIRESGLCEKYKNELKKITNINRSSRISATYNHKKLGDDVIILNKKEFIKRMCKNSTLKRSYILDIAADLDIKTPMKSLVKEIKENGVEVIN